SCIDGARADQEHWIEKAGSVRVYPILCSHIRGLQSRTCAVRRGCRRRTGLGLSQCHRAQAHGENLMKQIARLVIALSTAAVCSLDVAHTYPETGKSVRLVVPFAPGSGTDLMTRILAEDMQAGLGVPIVVENKPGANGYVAAEYISKQAPDGYTLLLGTS